MAHKVDKLAEALGLQRRFGLGRSLAMKEWILALMKLGVNDDGGKRVGIFVVGEVLGEEEGALGFGLAMRCAWG